MSTRAYDQKRIEAKEARWREVQSMWAAGDSMLDICEHMGWSISQLKVQQSRMRAAGWELPARDGGRDERGRYQGASKSRKAHKHGRPRGR